MALFLRNLKWIDGQPLWPLIEPYRRQLFAHFDARDESGVYRHNLGLDGRAKKNWKTTDAHLLGLHRVVTESPGGSQVYSVSNDLGQSRDALDLVKKLIKANPFLLDWVKVKRDIIERKDGEGFLEILPAQDAIGAHGKTYRLLVVDEIHGHRDYAILEALAMDPTRPDAQQWITSYASVFHRPGVPLYDLIVAGKAGTDRRMLFSWYAADHCTDSNFATRLPEERANPSMTSWQNPGYLDQQRRRLPAHMFRRLHLNLPGLPEGSAFQPEPVMDAISRGVVARMPEAGFRYFAFVDMSGGLPTMRRLPCRIGIARGASCSIVC